MKLLLIDGNSVLFRGFYATCYGNIMKTSFGVYTNAVYAFSNMMEKALNTIKPDYCLVAFDKGKHTFRHEIDKDYKAGRRETPEELVGQFALVREMLEACNIRYLEMDDIEADDIVGSMAKKYPIETCIFSSDHDLLQLIDDSTSVYIMKKGMSELQKLDEKGLMEEYGLKPYQVVDFKGLAGDTSDNIKGVEGVGEKTAVKLLKDFDTCEGIYENIDKVTGKLKDKLLKDRESCFKSKKLATIKTDVNLDYDLDFFKLDVDEEGRNDFFKKYEMYSLVRDVQRKEEELTEINPEVEKISEELYNEPLITFVSDEFTYYKRKIEGLCFRNGEKFEYISYANLLKDERTLEFLASERKKTVYDYKAVLHCMKDNGLKIGPCADVFIMAYLSNCNNNDLDKILTAYHKQLPLSMKDVWGTPARPLVPERQKLYNYYLKLSEALYDINIKVRKELEEKELTKLYEEVELPLAYVLFSMEDEGIHCDIKDLEEIAEKTGNLINKLQSDIYSLAGEEFNLNSPKQLKEVLFDRLDLPDLKKGSTNAEVLEKLKDYHPIVSKILDYRKYTKLYSSYAEGLQRYIDENGKIHTVFSQTIVQTGRLSSYDPNLQNISVRDEDGKEIRKAFKPSKDHVLMSSDYSQIELRVLASLAGEEKMIEAFNSGADIHTRTAMDVFKVSKEEVTDTVRRHAKAVNFGVVYGISDFGLANQTNLSFSDARKFIDDYFKTYPKIKKYLDAQVSFCKENGYVKTILGRRRYISEINDRNFMVREFGKRAAMNSTVQGSAADIIKIAMINIFNEIKERKLKSRLLLQVHDELIFDVCNDELEIMKELVLRNMSHAYDMPVKLSSSMAIGNNWLEAK